MVENKKKEENENEESKGPGGCPVSEWVRHGLYVGGMIAMHTGLCASASVASKSDKCPVGEWGRHAVYVGGFLALASQTSMVQKLTSSSNEKEESKCPVHNELYRHAAYVAGWSVSWHWSMHVRSKRTNHHQKEKEEDRIVSTNIP